MRGRIGVVGLFLFVASAGAQEPAAGSRPVGGLFGLLGGGRAGAPAEAPQAVEPAEQLEAGSPVTAKPPSTKPATEVPERETAEPALESPEAEIETSESLPAVPQVEAETSDSGIQRRPPSALTEPAPGLAVDLESARRPAPTESSEVQLPPQEIRGEIEKPDIFFLLPKARGRGDEQVIRARIHREITRPLIKEWLEEELLLK